ncbi:DUF3365 domain-containing protein [Crateriforma conspicua]|uniref:Tll0287-like domain-containing protein n=1 Tax=Crateriforma conspicua TaxID=2527996 RepID=A0A5C6FQR0_9PLAN|nr:DUF3365 domain-containing protein [Crateriforma conspicua]TWU64576.1 hypothetical protein V7x_01200 [Crateriforma conspicua]
MRNHLSTNRLAAIVTLVLAVTAAGCGKESASTAKQPLDEADSNRVIVDGKSPSDAQKQAMLAAKDALFTKLSGRLMEAMGSQGPAGAITVCQTEAPQIATEVSEEHDLRIGRTGVRLRNSSNEPPAWAKPLTDAKTDTPTFVVLDNEDAAALLPIKLQGQCLMCHGPKEQIAPIIQDQLAKLYPDDEATGFHEGDLRGWFWIEMPSS